MKTGSPTDRLEHIGETLASLEVDWKAPAVDVGTMMEHTKERLAFIGDILEADCSMDKTGQSVWMKNRARLTMTNLRLAECASDPDTAAVIDHILYLLDIWIHRILMSDLPAISGVRTTVNRAHLIERSPSGAAPTIKAA